MPDAPPSARADRDLLAVREGPVLTLTINRPERRNAMTWDVIAGLRRELARAKVDPAVRVVVLTGAGDQAFCAGADLSGMVPKDPGARRTSTSTTTWHGAGWPSCSRRCGSSASRPSPGSRAGPWRGGSASHWPATW